MLDTGLKKWWPCTDNCASVSTMAHRPCNYSPRHAHIYPCRFARRRHEKSVQRALVVHTANIQDMRDPKHLAKQRASPATGAKSTQNYNTCRPALTRTMLTQRRRSEVQALHSHGKTPTTTEGGCESTGPCPHPRVTAPLECRVAAPLQLHSEHR